MTMRTVCLATAGLVLAPLAWAVNMQLGQVLPYADCGARLRWNLVCSGLLLLSAGASGVVSWRTASRHPGVGDTFRFVARVAALTAAIFAVALLLQGMAGIILTGCER
jgi:hypothetical protein